MRERGEREGECGWDGRKESDESGRRLKKSNCSVEEAGSRKGLSPPFGPSAALLCITEQVYPGEERRASLSSPRSATRHATCPADISRKAPKAKMMISPDASAGPEGDHGAAKSAGGELALIAVCLFLTFGELLTM